MNGFSPDAGPESKDMLDKVRFEKGNGPEV